MIVTGQSELTATLCGFVSSARPCVSVVMPNFEMKYAILPGTTATSSGGDIFISWTFPDDRLQCRGHPEYRGLQHEEVYVSRCCRRLLLRPLLSPRPGQG